MAANPVFCTNCGIEDERAEAYCPACGAARENTPKQLAGHIGFVLNELQREPMTSSSPAVSTGRMLAPSPRSISVRYPRTWSSSPLESTLTWQRPFSSSRSITSSPCEEDFPHVRSAIDCHRGGQSSAIEIALAL